MYKSIYNPCIDSYPIKPINVYISFDFHCRQIKITQRVAQINRRDKYIYLPPTVGVIYTPPSLFKICSDKIKDFKLNQLPLPSLIIQQLEKN